MCEPVNPLDAVSRASSALGAVQDLVSTSRDIEISPERLFWMLNYILDDLRRAEKALLEAV